MRLHDRLMTWAFGPALTWCPWPGWRVAHLTAWRLADYAAAFHRRRIRHRRGIRRRRR